MNAARVKFIPWIHPEDVQKHVDEVLLSITGKIISVNIVPVSDPFGEHAARDITITWEEVQNASQ